jgi:hypothetical protein
MEAVTSLLSACIGGLLVLLGDGVRRHREARQATRRQLAEAATQVAVVYHRLGGALSDSRERGVPLLEVNYIEPDRREVSTRLWTKPGSMEFLESSGALMASWRVLLAAYDDSSRWQSAWDAHLSALHAFQTAIREYMGEKPSSPNP